VLDATTRTASIELEIPNGDYRLKPGMYARVNITTANKRDALVVPSNAVVDFNGRRGVFIPGQNNTATFRPVRVGLEEDTRVEIIDGLEEGDTIIGTGAGGLTDGGRYQVAGRNGGQGGGPNGTEGRSGGQGRTAPGRGQTRGGDDGGEGPSFQPATDGTASPAATGERPRRGGGQGVQGAEGLRGRGDGSGRGFGDGTGRRGRRGGGDAGAGQPPAGNQ
jgi:hypothetical protein